MAIFVLANYEDTLKRFVYLTFILKQLLEKKSYFGLADLNFKTREDIRSTQLKAL